MHQSGYLFDRKSIAAEPTGDFTHRFPDFNHVSIRIVHADHALMPGMFPEWMYIDDIVAGCESCRESVEVVHFEIELHVVGLSDDRRFGNTRKTVKILLNSESAAKRDVFAQIERYYLSEKIGIKFFRPFDIGYGQQGSGKFQLNNRLGGGLENSVLVSGIDFSFEMGHWVIKSYTDAASWWKDRVT